MCFYSFKFQVTYLNLGYYLQCRPHHTSFFSVVQPLHRGIRCCVKGSETTFKLVYRAAVNNVQHGLDSSTDAQWVIDVTPLMKTGCTEKQQHRLYSTSPKLFSPSSCFTIQNLDFRTPMPMDTYISLLYSIASSCNLIKK